MEGGKIAVTDAKFNNVGQSINKINKTEELIDKALNLDIDTDAHKLALDMKEGKVKPNDMNIGELYVNFAKDGGDTSFVLEGAEQSKPNKEIVMSDRLRALYIADETNSIIQNWDSLGEEGKAAFSAFAEITPERIEKDPLKYYTEFAKYYNAGINGEDFKKFNAENKGTMLDNQQKLVAFNSGKTDAKTSLNVEKANVKSAVRFKKEGVATMDNDVAGLIENDNSISMSSDVKTTLDKVSRALGVKAIIENEVATSKGFEAEGSYSEGIVRIPKNVSNPVLYVLNHEITHRAQELSPKAYRKFRNYVMKHGEKISKTGKTSFDVIGKQAEYLKSEEKLSNEGAMDEIVSDFAEFELMLNEDFINDIAENEPDLAKRILNWIKDIIATVKEALGIVEPSLERAQQLWENAIRSATKEANKTQKNTTDEGSGGVSYSINPDFASNIDKWDGKQSITFGVGFTSDALKSIGVPFRKIIIRSGKIAELLKKHKGMTKNIIKRIPEILENPIMVLKSKTIDTRVVIFGEVRDESIDKNPVTVILEIQPDDESGKLLDLNIVVNAYGKTGDVKNFIETSDLLYLDKNKERTKLWLQGIGLQLPADAIKLGSIGSITYQNGIVKIVGMPYKQYMQNSNKNTNTKAKLSIKEKSSNKSETEQLKDIIKYLKEEHKADLKRSKGVTMDKNKVNRIAKNLIKDYSSEADLDVVSDKINKLYEFIGNKVDEKGNELNYETLSEKAQEIAKEIVEESVTKSNELAEDYPELVAYLKGTNIIVSNRTRSDVKNFDDMKKRNKGGSAETLRFVSMDKNLTIS